MSDTTAAGPRDAYQPEIGSSPARLPIACGAIGDYDPQAVARVAAGLDASLAEVHRDGSSILYLDREPARWLGAEGRSWGLAWNERVPDRSAQAGSWREAASGGACGLLVDGQCRAIHASGSAVAPLYWMRASRAAYFATTIDALARARLGSLSPDWEAWASILAVSYPHNNRTPFTEIRRLPPLAMVRTGGGGTPEVTDGGLAWVDEEPLGPAEGAERIVAALRDEVARLEQIGPILCPLTGGLDSRLIACLLAERDLVAGTYTVNTGLGHDVEERIAGRVAAELGLPHTVVEPERPGYATELEAGTRRLEYQSMLHIAMDRLVAGLPAGRACSDGFAGTLIKDNYVNRDVLAAPHLADALFDRLYPDARRPMFRMRAWRALREPTRDAFLRDAARFAGHHAEAILALYWARSYRMIGSSPARIVGERQRLYLPLVADAVAGAAVAVDAAEKLDGRFYRRVLELAAPSVASLPTNHDVTPPPSAPERWMHGLPEARAAHLALLERSPLRPWFSQRLERSVARRQLDPIDRWTRPRVRLQSICAFGLWCERYGEEIGEPDPSELFA